MMYWRVVPRVGLRMIDSSGGDDDCGGVACLPACLHRFLHTYIGRLRCKACAAKDCDA